MSVRAAVVGCGFQGCLHLSTLSSLPEVEVVALCDRDERRAQAAAERFGVPGVHLHHRELLEGHPLDLLTICTMPDTHRDIALDALAAGADVLCEKPMAHTLQDAREMALAARRANRLLSVGFNLRHSSAARAIRDLVERGELGRLVCARGSMLETEVPWWGPHQVKAISGGGAIASTAVHMIDLLMWLAGNPRPLTATASMARLFPGKRGKVPEAAAQRPYDVEDLAFGHVRFDSGFWLTIEGGWTWDAPGSECDFDLVGESAQVSAAPLRLWRERDGELCDLTGEIQGDLDFERSIAAELEEMVDSVRERRAPLTTAQQALEAQAVVDALYRSAACGHEVEVEDVSDLKEALT